MLAGTGAPGWFSGRGWLALTAASRLGGRWPQWTSAVRAATRDCWEPIHAAAQAVLGCWRELAEYLAASAPSIQATNIGQQITLPESREDVAAGAT